MNEEHAVYLTDKDIVELIKTVNLYINSYGSIMDNDRMNRYKVIRHYLSSVLQKPKRNK